MQEVYLAAIKKAVEIEKHPNVEAWFGKATVFAIRQYWRGKSKDAVYLDDLEKLIADPVLFEDTLASNDYIRELLEYAPTQLPPVERDIFVWKFRQRMTNDEIAEKLAIKPDTVGRRIRRMRGKLKKIKKSFDEMSDLL
jgi:RNA polymerase sigma factor (sigma-70 family)